MPPLPAAPHDILPPPVQTARRLSRYLSRMLDSQPWLGTALVERIDAPIVEADMQRFLAARAVVFGGGDVAEDEDEPSASEPLSRSSGRNLPEVSSLRRSVAS